jgi:outer membrane biosynthesis protein TonB
VDTSILSLDLEPLNARIEQTREKLRLLEGEQRAVETEIEDLAVVNQRFDALRDVCKALHNLDELDSGELFWEGAPGNWDANAHLALVRERIGHFEEEIRGAHEKRESLQARVNELLDELYHLQNEVRQAYAREERRQEEFAIVREISVVPYRMMIMPWANDEESESRLRRAVALALLLCFIFGSLFSIVNVPMPDRSAEVEIPKRLAMLVKKEPPKPEPVPEKPKEEKKPELDEPEKIPEKTEVPKEPPKPVPAETKIAREKAETTGILAFKDSFADLLEDIPVANLGIEALSNEAQAAGQARAQRSLVSMQAQGSSGGVSTAAVSRNIGSGNVDRLGRGVGFARVESAVAGLAEEVRPLSSGPGPARTDEEIQIVFERYKAALYRIYNTELRKNPTLRGKMLLRITIEPGGEVSMCTVEATDLASPELVAQIVDRVTRFNFGPKDNVPKTTILYPIDFLPAG